VRKSHISKHTTAAAAPKVVKVQTTIKYDVRNISRTQYWLNRVKRIRKVTRQPSTPSRIVEKTHSAHLDAKFPGLLPSEM
jgi:hypothetical protein